MQAAASWQTSASFARAASSLTAMPDAACKAAAAAMASMAQLLLLLLLLTSSC
jgi:hypothetical protein